MKRSQWGSFCPLSPNYGKSASAIFCLSSLFVSSLLSAIFGQREFSLGASTLHDYRSFFYAFAFRGFTCTVLPKFQHTVKHSQNVKVISCCCRNELTYQLSPSSMGEFS